MFEDFGVKMFFTVDVNEFVKISLGVLFIAFLIRFFCRKIGFEHLKIMFSVTIFAFTLHYATQLYQIETIHSFKKDIIEIKALLVLEEEKNTYTDEITQEIEALKSFKAQGVIFGVARIILFGTLVLMIRDTFGERVLFFIRKYIAIIS